MRLRNARTSGSEKASMYLNSPYAAKQISAWISWGAAVLSARVAAHIGAHAIPYCEEAQQSVQK